MTETITKMKQMRLLGMAKAFQLPWNRAKMKALPPMKWSPT